MNARQRNPLSIVATFAAAAILSNCSGGGGGGSSLPVSNSPATSGSTVAANSVAVSFVGSPTGASNARRTLGLAGQTITVTFNGQTVATGTLDANQSAVLHFTSNVPRGATVLITVGTLTASVVLVEGSEKTNVTVTVNADGTLAVNAKDDNGNENEDEQEDSHGNHTSVVTNGQTLPSNLPFTVTATCGTIIITATDAKIASLDFIEKFNDDESDDDAGARGFIEVKNLPFSTTQNNPFVEAALSGAARFEIRVFDASHHRLVDVRAPIGAVTPVTQGTPAPCPSTAPTLTPIGSAQASPTPHPSASPEPTSTPRH